MKQYHFGLIGYPVGHTMSPFIHKELFRISGIEADYTVFSVPPEMLTNPAQKLQLLQLDGFNVTIPHKQAVMALLDKTDETAAAFSSVNTIKNENGRLCGFTTDGIGFQKSLRSAGIAMGSKNLILGSGGVSRVIAFELADASYFPDITICVRESGLSSAALLAEALRKRMQKQQKDTIVRICQYNELDPNEAYGLIANGTPLGMYPSNHTIPQLPEELYRNAAAVFDAVYNPEETEFLKKARHAGTKAIGGMDMLVWQAAAAQSIWYGAEFDPEQISQISQSATIEMNRMFCGKGK
ncbi:shikimate dehydrogenase [Clostridium merdae]|uniref:shikimate dehydrogenase n=1 Tax=Clostridium merdae TaxID=1958780 RepID=UPI000A2683AA|nr:shikimate dehydrogenase [Clostridium merdae]